MLIVLLYLLRQDPVPVTLQAPGLESLLVIDGPGRGDFPVFERPLAAAYGPTGDIYVSDTGHGRVCVFTDKGRFLREFGRVVTDTPTPQRVGALSQPAGLAVSDDGTVYVADLRLGSIMVFDDSGDFVRALRPSGEASTTAAWAPTDVALADNVVAAAHASGVTLFTPAGRLRKEITAFGGVPLVRPNGVAFAEDGTVVVSDTRNVRVVAFDVRGGERWILEGGAGVDQVFALPRGLSVAQDGSVLIADAFRFALVRVSDSGEYLGTFGKRGVLPTEFQFPNDVDMRRDSVLVADKENNRVQVLRMVGVFSEDD
jgi:DNA-binding beta-propeller fold protein YncE